MPRQVFLTYLKGERFTVEAEVLEINGQKVVKGMEVQIPFELPPGVVDPEGQGEYYLILPDSILDNCYTDASSGAPTLRDHFRSEVVDRNLSIDGHLTDDD